MACVMIKALLYRLACSAIRMKGSIIILIILPIVLSGLVLLLTLKFVNEGSHEKKATIFQPVNIMERVKTSPSGAILGISPDNNNTRQLMGAADVSLRELGYYSTIFFQNTSKGVSNYLTENYEGVGLKFGVHFEELSSSHLVYMLRGVGSVDWHSGEKYPSEPQTGTMMNGEFYVETRFLAFQVAINEAYLISAANITQSQCNLQAFPHSPNESSGRTTIISQVLNFDIIYIAAVLMIFAQSLSQEKNSGIRELLKINGIKMWMIYGHWFALFGLITLVAAVINTVLWTLTFGGKAIIPNSDPVLIFVILIIYYCASLCFGGFMASFISNPRYSFLVTIFFLSTHYLVQYLKFSTSVPSLVALALLPTGGMFGIHNAIIQFEASMMGVQFRNLFTNPSVDSNTLPVGINMSAMVISIFLYLVLMVYVDAIKPGRYGRAKPWHFIFPKCWKARAVAPGELSVKLSGLIVEEKNEILPVALEAVLLVKVFGAYKAVDNLSVKFYANKITALLGHNGAGKSTFFAMLTGMYSPTSGDIISGNLNIFKGKNMDVFRNSSGFCPQHDLLLGDLTVRQHLIFFAMLKGSEWAKAEEQCEKWITKFNLKQHSHKGVAKLSGGMKRKLCLSIALVGEPKFLFLDEPTSGLDPESRRKVWDVLLAERGACTVIISTHYMEEADVLGDYIAIISQGRLRCFGTASYLKQHFGSGYILNFTIKNDESNNLLRFVQQIIPSATVNSRTDKTMSLGLPATEIENFPYLLRALETRYGRTLEPTLACSPMDDVFFKVQLSEGVQMAVDNMALISASGHQQSKWVFLNQVIGLMIKHFIWVLSSWPVVLFVIIIPPLSMFLAMHAINGVLDHDLKGTKLSLSLDAYKGSTALIAKQPGQDRRVEAVESAISKSGGLYKELRPHEKIVESLLDSASHNLLDYRQKMVTSFDFRNIPTALYSTFAYHSMPIAYGILVNALLYEAKANTSITTYSYPYEFNGSMCNSIHFFLPIISLWLIFAFAVLLLSTLFVIFPHVERITLFKHLQIMTGIHPFMYWIAIFIADFSMCMVVMGLSVLVLIFSDSQNLLTSVVKILLVLLVLHGVSGIWCSYFFSNFFKKYSSAMQIMLLVCSGGAILFFVSSSFEATNWMNKVFYLIPWVALVGSQPKIIKWSLLAKDCASCFQSGYCSRISDVTIQSLNLEEEIIYLVVDCGLYFTLVLLFDYGVFGMFRAVLEKHFYGEVEEFGNGQADVDLIAEKDKVVQWSSTPRNDESPMFVSHSIGKKFSHSFTGVYDVTFAVKKGECFGLLGVNGAGKSTTFKIFTGSLIPTKGDAGISEFQLSKNKHQFLKQLGYCPQQEGLLQKLTARQILLLFGRLRCIRSSHLSGMVQGWVDALNMSDICDKPCENYSGGNRRKLSTAVALIGDPPVVLLDEPTSGVDPVTRYKIWSILRHCLDSNKQTIIITSHSMYECEAICGRLTIMVQGSMKCIGTIPHLKRRYGRGCVLQVKLIQAASEEAERILQTLIETTYRPHIELKSKQHGLLLYFISYRKMKLHEIMEIMIRIKKSQEIIDDFTLSDVSLEQVFLSFAKDT